MRDFVNRRIQKYFSGRGSLESVLQDNANTFANALITLILKEDLLNFGFLLQKHIITCLIILYVIG